MKTLVMFLVASEEFSMFEKISLARKNYKMKVPPVWSFGTALGYMNIVSEILVEIFSIVRWYLRKMIAKVGP